MSCTFSHDKKVTWAYYGHFRNYWEVQGGKFKSFKIWPDSDSLSVSIPFSFSFKKKENVYVCMCICVYLSTFGDHTGLIESLFLTSISRLFPLRLLSPLETSRTSLSGFWTPILWTISHTWFHSLAPLWLHFFENAHFFLVSEKVLPVTCQKACSKWWVPLPSSQRQHIWGMSTGAYRLSGTM